MLNRRTLFILTGFGLFALMLLNPLGLQPMAARAVACALLMVLLWVSEAVPMAAVALLPLVLFPLLGLSNVNEVAVSYANPVIFLFMGGFMIGLAIEKCGLHRRMALHIIRLTGTGGRRIILGFILATGLLSMWLSNTATTMMMFPIALSVLAVLDKPGTSATAHRNTGICLMLSVAYASNFGGIATLVGTPPNVAYAAFLRDKYDYAFRFAEWMYIGLPIAILLMAALYFIMTRLLYRQQLAGDEQTHRAILAEIEQLGTWSTAERRVLVVFVLTALAWIFRSLIVRVTGLTIDDNMIAVAGALLLFLVSAGDRDKPGSRLLEWEDTQRMAWGILLLFGGGIALAHQLEKAGIIQSIGQSMAAAGGLHPFWLILLIALASIFISELMSNVAQVIVFAPVVAGMADAMGRDPLLLATPMVLAASCASMLPMGTPPNAIVFGSGLLRLRDMVRTGFVVNLVAVVLITLFCYYLLPVMVQRIR